MTKDEFAAARAELGLSLPKMAKMLDVVRTTAMRWESGDVEISGPVGLLIQRILADHRERGGVPAEPKEGQE
jgi:DNA-binding transcriptional regulator YiaG